MYQVNNKVNCNLFGEGVVTRETIEYDNGVVVEFKLDDEKFSINYTDSCPHIFTNIGEVIAANPTLTNLTFNAKLGDIIKVRSNKKDSWQLAEFRAWEGQFVLAANGSGTITKYLLYKN